MSDASEFIGAYGNTSLMMLSLSLLPDHMYGCHLIQSCELDSMVIFSSISVVMVSPEGCKLQ